MDFLNWGILPDAALTGLTDAEKSDLQTQATKQWMLGSILSGDPSAGFKSAISLPEQALAAQKRIRDAEAMREITNAARSSFIPTSLGATQTAPGSQLDMLAKEEMGMSDTSSPISRSTVSALTSNPNIPRVWSDKVYSDRIKPVLAAQDPAKYFDALKGSRPVASEPGAIFRDPFSNQVTAANPSALNKGEEYIYDSRNNIVGVKNMEGAIKALSERQLAEKSAAAQFELKPVIENGQEVLRPVSELVGADKKAAFDRAKGDVAALQREIALTKPTETNRLSILNQELAKAQDQVKTFSGASTAPVSKLSAPEAAYQGGWEKIRDNAYKGYETATGRAGTLQSLQNIMNRPDFDTNAFSNYKSQLAGVLNASGIATDKQKDYLDSAAGFRQGLNTIAAQSVSELSGSTSNFDLEFSQGRFATLKDTKQANQYAIDLLAASDARKKDYYNFVNNNRSPDVNQKWQESDQGKTSLFESASMRKYLPQSTVTDGPYKGQTAYKLPNGEVKVFPK